MKAFTYKKTTPREHLASPEIGIDPGSSGKRVAMKVDNVWVEGDIAYCDGQCLFRCITHLHTYSIFEIDADVEIMVCDSLADVIIVAKSN